MLRVLFIVATASAMGMPPATRPSCAACVAIASELEFMMRSEWSHLNMTVRDRKRVLAADAVANQACDEAVESMLKSICTAVDSYAIGRTHGGELYYQRVRGGDPIIVSGGSLSIGSAKTGLAQYCREVVAAHEDALARAISEGTDDLQRDLCVEVAHECTEEGVAAIPVEASPHRRVLKEGES